MPNRTGASNRRTAGIRIVRATAATVRRTGLANGDLTTAARTNPVLMVNPAGTSPVTGVTSVAAGDNHTCARLNTGQVICTGANNVGQLGAGPGPNASRPIGVHR